MKKESGISLQYGLWNKVLSHEKEDVKLGLSSVKKHRCEMLRNNEKSFLAMTRVLVMRNFPFLNVIASSVKCLLCNKAHYRLLSIVIPAKAGLQMQKIVALVFPTIGNDDRSNVNFSALL
ncbi:hypothetical protein [Pedobacter agri]|uniref:hypothetical protein n=1 Tax=Pedobacter agri TaxID=454586 RepID=UPI0027869247|nr:hypothetical protein [Pedobacter agri]MDQ1140159.1 hypothetical protein [Pedobacter agri]